VGSQGNYHRDAKQGYYSKSNPQGGAAARRASRRGRDRAKWRSGNSIFFAEIREMRPQTTVFLRAHASLRRICFFARS
jgi:hypothetical protein